MKNRPQERGQEPDGLTCRKTFTAVCSFHARMQTIIHLNLSSGASRLPAQCSESGRNRAGAMNGDPQEGEGGRRKSPACLAEVWSKRWTGSKLAVWRWTEGLSRLSRPMAGLLVVAVLPGVDAW